MDPAGSSVTFEIAHRGDVVEGRFGTVSGSLRWPEQDTPGELYVAVATASIDTGIGLRDTHLRSGDYFDAQRFPVAVFQSGAVVAAAEGLRAAGTLNFLGVERPLEVRLEVNPSTEDGPSHTTGFAIDRSDFGMLEGLEGGSIGDRVVVRVVLNWQEAE